VVVQPARNRPPTGAARSPNLRLGVESVLDMLAKKIGMDPVELRLKNAARSAADGSMPIFLPACPRTLSTPKAEIGEPGARRAADFGRLHTTS